MSTWMGSRRPEVEKQFPLPTGPTGREGTGQSSFQVPTRFVFNQSPRRGAIKSLLIIDSIMFMCLRHNSQLDWELRIIFPRDVETTASYTFARPSVRVAVSPAAEFTWAARPTIGEGAWGACATTREWSSESATGSSSGTSRLRRPRRISRTFNRRLQSHSFTIRIVQKIYMYSILYVRSITNGHRRSVLWKNR